MRRGLCALALVPACATFASIGFAQGDVWTERRTVARAIARAPAVQTAQAALEAARALTAFGRVSVIGNPVVSARAMVGIPDRQAATHAVLLGLPIDVSGRREYFRREAAWAIRQAEAVLDATVNDVRAAARTSYVETAVADAMVTAAGERVTTARELLARTQARLRAQAATALDLALTERELGQAESDLAAARRERQEAAGRFQAVLDLPAPAEVTVAPVALPQMPAGMRREDAVAGAIASRREQAGVAAAAARARVSVNRLRAQAVAPVVVNGEFEWQAYQQGSFGVSAQWALPLFHTAQGERAVAASESRGLETRHALTGRGVAREAATAWSVLAARLDELRALRDRAVPAATRTVSLTETLFESGAADSFRVLLARQDFAAARIRLLTAVREAWRARIALDRAVGSP